MLGIKLQPTICAQMEDDSCSARLFEADAKISSPWPQIMCLRWRPMVCGVSARLSGCDTGPHRHISRGPALPPLPSPVRRHQWTLDVSLRRVRLRVRTPPRVVHLPNLQLRGWLNTRLWCFGGDAVAQLFATGLSHLLCRSVHIKLALCDHCVEGGPSLLILNVRHETRLEVWFLQQFSCPHARKYKQ